MKKGKVLKSLCVIAISGFIQQALAADYLAPQLLSVKKIDGSSVKLTFKVKSATKPSGGYDFFIGGSSTTTKDTNNTHRVVDGKIEEKILKVNSSQKCFKVEARYLQANPDVFKVSNAMCLPSSVSYVTPSITSVEIPRKGEVKISISHGSSLKPSGGYDVHIGDSETTTKDTNALHRFPGNAVEKILPLSFKGKKCFKVEARYLQADPDEFRTSKPVCVVNEPDGPQEPSGDPLIPSYEGKIKINNTMTISKNMSLNKGLLVKSNTRVVGANGAVLKIDGTSIQGGLLIKGVRDVIIENLTIDISSERNFVTGIWMEESENIVVRNVKFINSKKSIVDPAWTMHATNGRNIKNVWVHNNHADGSQLKLNGGTYSAENIYIMDNFVTESPQMGIAVVAQPHTTPVMMKNIIIARNKLDLIDNHPIYVGVDHGKGEYANPVTVEGVEIYDNVISGVNYDPSDYQASKGVLINGTKDTKDIRVYRNSFSDKIVNDFIGIQFKCQDGGMSQNIEIFDNKMSNFGNFNVYVEGATNFKVLRNISSKGKGVIIRSSQSGEVIGNMLDGVPRKVRVQDSSHVIVE